MEEELWRLDSLLGEAGSVQVLWDTTPWSKQPCSCSPFFCRLMPASVGWKEMFGLQSSSR